MAAPEITAFGDGNHEPGATGLSVAGGGLGAFPGSLWMFENADGSGAADELTVGGWTDMALTGVEIPASPNNAEGTVYLRVQREDLAWSFPFQFTLGGAASAPVLLSARLNQARNALFLYFDQDVSIGAGGNGGVAVTPSGGAATATYSSGDGSSVLVYSLSRTIGAGETITADYTQPGDGIEGDSGGLDVATFSGQAVTNPAELLSRGPRLHSQISLGPVL